MSLINLFKYLTCSRCGRDIYSGHFPPIWGGGEFLSKMKNREEFEGGLHEKRKGKGGKRRKKKREKEKTEKEKREKGKERMERDKKWIRVLKGKIILSLFCFPVFGYVP